MRLELWVHECIDRFPAGKTRLVFAAEPRNIVIVKLSRPRMSGKGASSGAIEQALVLIDQDFVCEWRDCLQLRSHAGPRCRDERAVLVIGFALPGKHLNVRPQGPLRDAGVGLTQRGECPGAGFWIRTQTPHFILVGDDIDVELLQLAQECLIANGARGAIGSS